METSSPTTCASCSSTLPPNGFFCGGCLTQFKCKACNAILVPAYAGCINCGTPKEVKNNGTAAGHNINTFRATEKPGERNIEATFSDNVAKHFADIISGTYSPKLSPQQQHVLQQLLEEPAVTDDPPAAVTTAGITAEEVPDKQQLESTNEPEILHLDDVERSAACSETHWILIYSFYLSDHGKNTFSYIDVFNKYKNARGTESRMGNFSTKWKSLFPNSIRTIKTDEFRLTEDAITSVKNIISGKTSSQPGVGTVRKKNKGQQSESSNEKTTAPKKSSGLKRLSDINFYPNGKESLEDFYKKFTVNNDDENNLLFIYYLQEILGISPITVNHVFTCYHQEGLNIRIPENLKQSIITTKFRRGWIESKERSNLSVTTAGVNKIKFWNKKEKE